MYIFKNNTLNRHIQYFVEENPKTKLYLRANPCINLNRLEEITICNNVLENISFERKLFVSQIIINFFKRISLLERKFVKTSRY